MPATRTIALLLTGWIVSAAAPAWGQASLTPLGDLPGGSVQSVARGVSADGRVVVGWSVGGSGEEAFRWTSTGGMAGLGDLPGATFASTAYATSADGSIVLGAGVGPSDFREAARWVGAGAPTGLGFAASGGYISLAYACSADGESACGENVYQPPAGGGPPPLPVGQAMRWTLAGGMVDLGTLPGAAGGAFSGSITRALAMSSDGSIIVGYGPDATAERPWRWTEAGGMVDIAQGQWVGRARGISPDGTVIVGTRTVGGLSEAFAWTEAGGRIDLGLVSGFASTAALDASIGGRRICGTAFGAGNLAIVWDRGIGWRSLSEALADAGVSTAGWTFQLAYAMSDDGTVIVGSGINPSMQVEAFRAVLPLPCRADFNGVGGVTVQDIFDFLVAYFANLPSADFNGVGGVTVQDIFDFLVAYFAGCAG